MAVISVLSAQSRQAGGTSAMRRMRREQNTIPAVIYGGKKDTLAIQISHKEMMKALEDESFYTRLLTVEIGDQKEQVILKDIQRHPVKANILHVDFYRVSADHKLHIKIPLRYTNEDKCEGIKIDGGMLIRNINEVEVNCLPGNIPEYIEIDVQDLRLNQHVHLSDIAWPEGVESVDLSYGEEHDLSAATIAEQRVIEEQEEEVAVLDEEGEEDADAEDEEGEAKGEE